MARRNEFRKLMNVGCAQPSPFLTGWSLAISWLDSNKALPARQVYGRGRGINVSQEPPRTD